MARVVSVIGVTPGFLNFLLAAGIAQGLRCSYADGLKRGGSTQPFLAWEP